MLEPVDDENSLNESFLGVYDVEVYGGKVYGVDYPLWRDNGAITILSDSLDDVVKTLNELIEEGRILTKELAAHITDEEYFDCLEVYGNTPDGGEDPRGKFWKLEHKLEKAARIAIVMAVIELEARINKFCFYNLGEVTTNAIESLPLANKLEVIHKVLGLAEFKGTSQYAAVRSLVKWRNAFVHGKW